MVLINIWFLGFYDIIFEELIVIFNEQELEFFIFGFFDIDVDDWKSNIEYYNYIVVLQQIQWFWCVICLFDKEEWVKFFQFVIGIFKVLFNGFKELEGMNGVSCFNIYCDYGNKDCLFSFYMCFNCKLCFIQLRFG